MGGWTGGRSDLVCWGAASGCPGPGDDEGIAGAELADAEGFAPVAWAAAPDAGLTLPFFFRFRRRFFEAMFKGFG